MSDISQHSSKNPCHHSPDAEAIVCHCLQVTHGAVAEAVATWDLDSLREICRYTGAGDGCTACHARLKAYLCSTMKAGKVRIA